MQLRVGSAASARLVVGAVAIAGAFLVAAPSQAGRLEAASRARVTCASGAKAFHGQATVLSYTEPATGTTPGIGGSETITLRHKATSLPFTVTSAVSGVLPTGQNVSLFTGKGKGGAVTVDDTEDFTNSSDKGSISANGPPSSILAYMLVFPGTCKYQVVVSYSVKTHFSGNADNPGTTSVTDSAISPLTSIPSSQTLSGTATVPVYYSACSTGTLSPDKLPPKQGCYGFDGSWAVDFEGLKRCKSIAAGKCGPPDPQDGTATFSWSLTEAQ
jgi:hypothetical protein